MIKLKKFRGAGAFSYQDWDIDLSDQGVVFVSGENEDTGGSNGAGKSVWAEVLEHTIYGKTSRGLKKNGILSLNTNIEPGFFAELEIEKDDKCWLVRQARSHKEHGTGTKIYENVESKWVDRTPKNNPGKDDAQTFVHTELLGLTENEFHGCVYLAQNLSHILVHGTAGERSSYLAKLFGLDRYDEIRKDVSSVLSAVTSDLSELQVLEGQADTLRSQLAELPAHLEVRVEILNDARKYADTLLTKTEETKAKYTALLHSTELRESLLEDLKALGFTNDTDALRADLAEADKEAAAISEALGSIRESLRQISTHEELQASLDKMQKPDQDAAELTTELEELSTKRVQLLNLLPVAETREKLQDKIASMEGLAELQTPKEDLDSLIEQCQAGLAKAEHILETCSAEIEKHEALDTPECPTCGHELDQEKTQELLFSLRTKAGKSRKKIAVYTEKLAQTKQAVGVHEEYAKAKSHLKQMVETPSVEELTQDVKTTKKRIKIAKISLEYAQEYDVLLRQLEASAQRLPATSKEVLQAEETSAKTSLQDVVGLRDKLKEGYSISKKIDTLQVIDVQTARTELRRAEETLAVCRPARMEIEAEWATLSAQLKIQQDHTESLTDLEEKLIDINTVRTDQRILQVLTKAIPKLKKRQLHQVVLAVRDVLPKYTSLMFTESPPAAFSVVEDSDSIDILMERSILTDDGGVSKIHVPVKALSGGEQKRLSVALLFTLHDLLSPRKRVDLLILDEVDGGLDAIGIEGLMQIVQHCKKSYGTVIMTSHRAGIAGAPYDQRWIVRKKDNVSRIIKE